MNSLIQKKVYNTTLGKAQKAPYHQGDIDLSDKTVVEAADRTRFEFVNRIVKEVETHKVFTKERNISDKIDAVITNKWLGIPIFAGIMFLVFYISQAEGPLGLGKWLESILGGGVEASKAGSVDSLKMRIRFCQLLLLTVL